MSKYVLDSNIIILIGRSLDFQNSLHGEFDLFAPETKRIISIVTIGELLVAAPQHTTGLKRLKRQQNFLKTVATAPLSDDIVKMYAELDLYSRGNHPAKKLIGSHKIMGKNDLWIAATAAHYNIPLITTDKDFDHLNDVFLTVHYIDQQVIP